MAAIYAEGIRTGDATFETDVPSWKAWDRAHLPGQRWVADVEGPLAGWIAAAPVSGRPAYAGVVEHSVYVAGEQRGQGIGRALVTTLVASTEMAGIWTIQTSIFPENLVSLALHASCGFRTVGRRERIATLNGVWRDTLLLERRSEVVE